ncbi:hypothetical protein V1520DRAFT_393751 [Lipomyces starkeyi]
MLSVQNEWEYRACYAIQWFWPIPIIPGVFFAPESPWWLVRCGRIEDVGRAIDRLTTKRADTNFNTEQKVAMMIHTNEMEKKVSSGTAFFDCLKHTDLRRTEIVSIVWLMQAFCGSALMGYSTYFYEQAGLPTTQSFNFTLIQYALGAFGTMFSKGGSWGIGSMLLLFTLVYDCTVGPVCYSLVAEIPATRLRSKSIRKVSARKFKTTAVDPFNGVTSELDTPKSAAIMVENVEKE